ncbi:MAG: fumarylacetoacetate hydrolase family protein [Betaproteobacteria bacterium]|nr:fumarylacetoacetate hydrolase family protein [Betaproteobacteria bacterium]
MNIERIARELLGALDQGGTVPSIVASHPEFGWDEGYRVAAELLRLRRARGERTVGRKIGFTNRNIWAEYGATAPIWAHVFDRTLVRASTGRATISLRGSARPRLEPEIAFCLKSPPPAGVMDPARVLESIEWLAPSFEIVDCHFADWKFGPADSAADFSLHWRLVIGAPRPLQSAEILALAMQLRDCRITLSRDGQAADQGFGANALGHPAAALAHLADVLSRQPQFEPLAPGEIVTTGTLTAAMPIKPGETWASRYEGLPGVTGLTLQFTS